MRSFEAHRPIFLRMDYVLGLSGLLSACNTFLDKVKKEWNERLKRYGTYLSSRLEEYEDESWRFEGEEGEIVRQAYNTLMRARKVIKEVVDRGEIDKSRICKVQKEIDEALKKLALLSLLRFLNTSKDF